MMKSDFERDFLEGEEDIRKIADAASAALLPNGSKERYEKQYKIFCDWRKVKRVKGLNQDLILAFFYEQSEKYKPSSLWAFNSMLKKTLIFHENVNIADFPKVSSFLKTKSLGCVSKKSSDLRREEVEKFLKEAPNEELLLIKVVTIFGVYGGCRRQELCDIKLQDVKHEGAVIVVKISHTKTHVSRVFSILPEGNGFNPVELIRNYIQLRPIHVKSDLFFCPIGRESALCSRGVKTIGKFPSVIAEYLGLYNASSYTGHCYRRTSATLLANAGADVLTLKRHGAWKSSTVAENYVAESMCNKTKIAKMIQCDNNSYNENEESRPASTTAVSFFSNQNVNMEIESKNQKKKVTNI